MTPALAVKGLKTKFFTSSGVVDAVDGVTFQVMPGEILGLVGESGSGKSVTGYSILGLVDAPGRVVDGSIAINGEEVIGLSEERLRRIRGKQVAMIFQDPMMTLNPVLTIGTQMIEALQAHNPEISAVVAWEKARSALDKVGVAAPAERLSAFPHQLSGGMRQRVVIATALLNDPDVIIADEPTTALDVTIQSQILSVVQGLCAANRTALVWITHDLSVVAGLANRIAVMYAGRIVEEGTVDDVLDRPAHPYTKGLIDSVPAQNRRGGVLLQIPGTTPNMLSLPTGCAFLPRCFRADGMCERRPESAEVAPGHSARCFHPLRDAHASD